MAGQTLTADRGQWSGTSPITYVYQWQSCDQSGGGCSNIAGATSQTYVLGQGDIGTNAARIRAFVGNLEHPDGAPAS